MELVIVNVRLINLGVLKKAPPIFIAKGFDDFVAIRYPFAKRLLVIALCQCIDRHFGVRKGRKNYFSKVDVPFINNT